MDDTPRAPRSRIADAALVALFLAAISAPMAVRVLGLDLGRIAENRERAPRPELRLGRAALAEFPSRFEAYYNDAFGLRDPLIRWNSRARVALGVSPSPNVLIGRKGWLFYAAEGAVDDLRRNHPLSAEELERWRRALEERREWLARRGIRYLVMFAPNKHTIYPEYLAGTYDHVTAETRYDQLARYLREHNSVDLVDLRGPLLKAKAGSHARLYYRRDTHWNDLGAYFGYREIVGALSRAFPGLEPRPLSDFRFVRKAKPMPDLSVMLGLGDVLPDVEHALEPRFPVRAGCADAGPGLRPEDVPDNPPIARQCPGADLPRAVIFRDSFSFALIPMLSEHFSRSLYVWHRPFDPAIIEREKPQVVIEEAVERRLWAPAPAAGLPESVLARK